MRVSVMRIRLPIAIAFVAALAISGYLAVKGVELPHSKVIHVAVFFVLTLLFYWAQDASRKRCINTTIPVCTLFLGVGTEFTQARLASRPIDSKGLAANAAGTLLALGLSTWYHQRLTERRRRARYDRLRQNLRGDVEAAPTSSEPVELNEVAPEPETQISSEN